MTQTTLVKRIPICFLSDVELKERYYKTKFHVVRVVIKREMELRQLQRNDRRIS